MLTNQTKQTKINMDNFIKYCKDGNIILAKETFDNFNNINKLDIKSYNKAFRLCCKNNHIKVAKWLYSLGIINIHSKNDYAFKICCSNGHIKLCKWLYSIGSIDFLNIEENTYYIFNICCQNNQLNICIWLYSLEIINIHANDDIFFTKYCDDEHLDIAKWLYSLGGFTDEFLNELFTYNCWYNNFLTVQWLYDLNKINIHFDNDRPIKLSCESGHLDIAKWLYSLNSVDIHAQKYFAFKQSCENQHLEVALWLCTLTDRYIITNKVSCKYKIIRPSNVLMKKLKNPKSNLSNITIEDPCMICLSHAQYMVQTECKHIYCTKCLKTYLNLDNVKCCYCQKIIDENSDKHLIYKKI